MQPVGHVSLTNTINTITSPPSASCQSSQLTELRPYDLTSHKTGIYAARHFWML